MKTAEETLTSYDCYSNYSYTSGGRIISEDPVKFINAMKAYGRQCAQQALKDAAEKQSHNEVRARILETTIQTP